MTKYKIYFAAGLLFALTFAGADLKTAKADYVDYVNGREVLVQYDWDTGKLDLIDISTGSVIGNDLDFTQDENGRGVPTGYDITPPDREETLGITDSSERAEDYSCSQVGVCGTTILGYSSDPNRPNYALYSATDAREIVTVYLRNSGQAQGNTAWEDAPANKIFTNHPELLSGDKLSAQAVNNILEELGADFKVDPNITGDISRKDLLDALKRVNEDMGQQEDSEEEGPSTPNLPPLGPFVPVTDCSFTATPTEILYSKSSQLRWNCNVIDECSIRDESGIVVRASTLTATGTVNVTPLKTTRYFLNCPDGKNWEVLVRVFSSGIQ